MKNFKTPFFFWLFHLILRIIGVLAVIIFAAIILNFAIKASNAYDSETGEVDMSVRAAFRLSSWMDDIQDYASAILDTATDTSESSDGNSSEGSETATTNTSSGISDVSSDDVYLTVEFIDVGQADCILIYTDNEAMIIDAGNNEDGELVVNYIESLGIDHLDYVIGTHAHEDHIGGLDDVINNLDVDYIMLPSMEYSSYTYQSLLEAAEDSSATTIYPSVGDTYSLGEATFTVLSCGLDGDDDLNASSIVIRLDYEDSSFMFTGDCLDENEEVMLESGLDLDVDILKVAHHGSYTSSSYEFLEAVTPLYSIIMCGVDNEYGHPHDVTIADLEDIGTEILRTDELGTIRIATDGEGYEITYFQTDTDGNT